MEISAMNLSQDDRAERVWGLLVSANYFDALQVRPILGRAFSPEDDRAPLEQPVAVISHGFWKRRFAGDAQVVGKPITLNGHTFTVVGVAPEDFRGTYLALTFDVYVPMMMQQWILPGANRLTDRHNHWLDSVAKLKPGVTREQAESNLNVIFQQLNKDFPDTTDAEGMRLYPMWRTPYGGIPVVAPVLLTLSAVVAVVLLIACANVANLLLARSSARRKEIAVRLSLGAGRWRLVRQLLTESVLLALLGGAAGLLMAAWSWEVLGSFVPPVKFPLAGEQGLDIRVLLFTFLVSIATGLVFGLAPALDASRADVVTTLKDETGAVAGGRGKVRLRHVLVVAQVSLSLVLLVSAALLIRSLQRAYAVEPGFNPRGVLLVGYGLFPSGYTKATGPSLHRQILERVAALPGVKSASLARRIPLGLGGSGSSSTTVELEGYVPAPDETVLVFYNNVGPGYFHTMQIPIVQGREFTFQDESSAPTVAVVNEALADRYWPGRDPIGRSIRMGDSSLTVIGVVRNSKFRNLKEEPRPFMYLSLLQFYRPDVSVHARTSGDPVSLSAAVRSAIQSLDPNLPILTTLTLEEHITGATFQQRMGSSLLGAFGGVAMLMAAIGLYGVMAFGVAQRTREIGIRLALGAQRSDVLRLVVGTGARLVGVGIAVGLGVALLVTRFLSDLLFDVASYDPVVFSSVVVLLGATSLLASYLPARRASRVDPMVALRYE
jgi:predicted permease